MADDGGGTGTERAGGAYIRNIAGVEAAVMRGQFNVAKVLRAAAHAQRLLAIDEARRSVSSQPSEALVNAAARDLREMAVSGRGEAIRSSALDILERSLASLQTFPDVPESNVAQSLWGCRVCGFIDEGDRPDTCEVCGALAPEFEWFGPFFGGSTKIGTLLPREALGILASAPDDAEVAVSGVDESVAGHRQGKGEWSAKETLAHMFETDLLFATRVRFMLDPGQSGPVPRPMPPWKLHEGKGYEDWPVHTLLRQHRAVREQTMALLQGLSEADWAKEKSGTTIAELATWLAQHEIGHTQQLRRLCGKPLESRPPLLRST